MNMKYKMYEAPYRPFRCGVRAETENENNKYSFQ